MSQRIAQLPARLTCFYFFGLRSVFSDFDASTPLKKNSFTRHTLEFSSFMSGVLLCFFLLPASSLVLLSVHLCRLDGYFVAFSCGTDKWRGQMSL